MLTASTLEIHRTILDLLRERGTVPSRAIAEHLGWKVERVTRLLSLLRDEGAVISGPMVYQGSIMHGWSLAQ